MTTTPQRVPQIVILGGGFGGLSAARGLRHAPARVTLIDRRNHHLFQPLLYQVATAGLSPAEIAVPIRSILSKQRNVEVLMAEVSGIDAGRRVVETSAGPVAYDFLVIALGSGQSYFGHPEWARVAPGLKSVDDATLIRRRVLLAFEQAEMEPDREKRRALLRFVVVGGGPTGVEMAGAIAELARFALARDFRHINPALSEVILIEAGARILSSFPESLSEKAARALAARHVQVRTGERVESVDEEGVVLGGQRIPARTVIWAAGVEASPAGKWLGIEVDRAGRVKIGNDLRVPGHPEIYVIGDTAYVEEEGKPLPGLAPVATQQGRYVASVLRKRLEEPKVSVPPFSYLNKGNLATIGRSSAVADLGWLRLSGFIAWVAWIAVHIFYLIGFRNRLIVMMEWAYAYVTFRRGARLITERSPSV